MTASHCMISGYTPSKSTATTVAGIGVPNHDGGQPPRAAFFVSVLPSRALFIGRALVGERSRSPVPSCRYANLILCPPTPIGVGRRASKNHDGGRNA
ncbi:hypothetical protein FQZ97_1033840 [compost metagenome]